MFLLDHNKEQEMTKQHFEEMIERSMKVAFRQHNRRREHFNYEQEVAMVKNAFDNHNIVRIEAPHTLQYSDAKRLAEKEAGGLPTRQE